MICYSALRAVRRDVRVGAGVSHVPAFHSNFRSTTRHYVLSQITLQFGTIFALKKLKIESRIQTNRLLVVLKVLVVSVMSRVLFTTI